MFIYEKLGYNKIQSRYIHEIILQENSQYYNNYFNKEQIYINSLISNSDLKKK